VMGVSTVLIGLTPTYAEIGIWAPILLVLFRLAQGFGAGAELAGAIAYVSEHTPRNRRAFFTSIPNAATAAGLVLAVGGFALMRDDHVRVDILYRPAPVRRKALLDLIGVLLFLVPYCTVAWIYCFPYVQRSWKLLEPSANPGGMPGLYILKTFILVFIVLVFLQGIAMALRSILVLAGREGLLPERYRYPRQN